MSEKIAGPATVRAAPLVGFGMTTLGASDSVTAPVEAEATISFAVPVIDVPIGAAAHVGRPEASVRICPLVPGARNVVVDAALWKGMSPAAPPAMFVVDDADSVAQAGEPDTIERTCPAVPGAMKVVVPAALWT